jgi:hypothetical protein
MVCADRGSATRVDASQCALSRILPHQTRLLFSGDRKSRSAAICCTRSGGILMLCA